MHSIYVLIRKTDNRPMSTVDGDVLREDEQNALSFYNERQAIEYHGNLPFKKAKDYTIAEYRIYTKGV